MTPRISAAEFKAIKSKIANRKERRKNNAQFIAKVSGKKTVKIKRKKSLSMSKLKKILWEAIRPVVYSQSPKFCLGCGWDSPPVACHIVPSSDSASTRFFLPNIYRGCQSCNDAERHRRGQWVKKHEQMFGQDYVDALYEMSRTPFPLKRWWVIEQTERMRKLGERRKN